MAGPQQSDRERWEALVRRSSRPATSTTSRTRHGCRMPSTTNFSSNCAISSSAFRSCSGPIPRRRRSVVPGRTCSSPSSTCSG